MELLRHSISIPNVQRLQCQGDTCSTLDANTTECQSGNKALSTVDYPYKLDINGLRELFADEPINNETINIACKVAEISEECVRDDTDVQACLNTGNYDKHVELRNILRPTACGASVIIYTTSLLYVSLIVSFFY
ncbi:hypothetical protein LOTGIDRAFT_233525 [Lottia gigantea]|uniref:Uncharacterized protein n=1 Tax=Lottia gigantea TaxID=225164 RepID=V4A2W3_LOTGI|nr:hypothetical protein LOTGIDRAFT_233525 [Lottia gigantea]ESO91037.1 hypothetical protein LOTGIDRAFT_233525 [Lottia gigantea]